jgi:hypothetical protein
MGLCSSRSIALLEQEVSFRSVFIHHSRRDETPIDLSSGLCSFIILDLPMASMFSAVATEGPSLSKRSYLLQLIDTK